MAFAPSLVRQLIQLTGFGTVEFRECAPIPHGLKSSIRYAAWQGIRQFIKAYLLVEKASSQEAIGLALDAFTPSECQNYFAAAGYDAT
jgi:hypothetical protein